MGAQDLKIMYFSKFNFKSRAPYHLHISKKIDLMFIFILSKDTIYIQDKKSRMFDNNV